MKNFPDSWTSIKRLPICCLLFFITFNAAAQQPFTLTPIKGLGSNDKKEASNWLNYKNEAGAFSLKIPGNVVVRTNEVPHGTYPDFPPTRFYIYSLSDTVNGKGYIFRYNDFPSGMYLSDKAATFQLFVKDLAAKGKIVKQPSAIMKDGIEGRAFDIVADQYYMQIQVFLRGNRQYLLLRQNLIGATPPAEDEFFDSFHFEAYDVPKGTPFTIGRIEVYMPEKPLLIPDTVDETSFISNNNVYYGTNRNSGGLYGIEHGQISKYYKNDNLDSLYIRVLKNINSEDDSTYKIRDVMIGEVPGKEQMTVSKGSGNHKRSRMWISGDDFYFQTLNTTEDEISSPQAEHFFNAVSQKGKSNFDIKASKIEILLKDLSSTDTVLYKQSRAAINYYKFSEDELPQLQAAIQKTYTDDTRYTGARIKLINEVIELKPPSIISTLKTIFEDPKNADEVRAHALATIPDIEKNHYDWYLNALTQQPAFKTSNAYRLFSPLTDSLDYAVIHFDQLLTLLNRDEYRPSVIGIASMIQNARDKDQYKSLLKTHGIQLCSNAMKDLGQYIKDSNQGLKPSASPLYAYLNILPATGQTGLTNEFTTKLLTVDSIYYLKNSAVVARIESGLPVEKQLLNHQLDSLDTRYNILYALQKKGKLASIDLKYRTPKEFAKLLLYNFVSEDYDVPQSISSLGSISSGKKTYHVFTLTYEEDGMKKEYLGIGGGIETPGKLDFDNGIGYSAYEPLEKDWTAQAKSLIAKLDEENQTK